MKKPLLIVFSGLPGVGKTTLAQQLSKKIRATYIRIDTIEQTLLDEGSLLSGKEGYFVAYNLAKDNLLMGNDVIADCVNASKVTRNAWHDISRLYVQIKKSIVKELIHV
jgi:predicted kinase